MLELGVTMGDGCVTDDDIRFCLDHHVSRFRINLANNWGREHAQSIQQIISKHALRREQARIVWDVPFPNRKPRYFTYEGKRYDVKHGSSLALIPLGAPHKSPAELVISRELFDHIRAGDRLIVGDGETALIAGSKTGDTKLGCTVTHDWFVSDGKSLTIENREHIATSDDDNLFLETVHMSVGPPDFAFSFVQDRSDLIRCRNHVPSSTHVMSKIETGAGVKNIDEIIWHSDSIMVARGDLALHAGFSALGRTQAQIIRQCNSAAKPVFVATELLASLSYRACPLRAEVSDIYNLATAIHSGGFFLTKESSMPGMLRKCLPLITEIIRDARREFGRQKAEG